MADEAGASNLWGFLSSVAGTGALVFGAIWNGGRRRRSEDAGRIELQNVTNQSAILRIKELERDVATQRTEAVLWEQRARRADRGWDNCRHQLQNLRQMVGSGAAQPGPEPPDIPLLETPL